MHWYVEGSVSCIFIIPVAVCCCVHNPHSSVLLHETTLEPLWGAICFWLPRHRLGGGEQWLLSACPPVPLMWPATRHPSVKIPLPLLYPSHLHAKPSPTSAMMSLLGLSTTLYYSPFKYVNTGIFVSEMIPTCPTYRAKSTKMCSCCKIVNTDVALGLASATAEDKSVVFVVQQYDTYLTSTGKFCFNLPPSREFRGQGQL